ncbi:MAG: DUF1295 domain-containing protein, partial [Myxococcales bacterium]|nr:DUF1295 domain-containing protein [Myxococcales bacterium]
TVSTSVFTTSSTIVPTSTLDAAPGGAPPWLIPPPLLADDQLARLYLALLAIGAALAVISLASQMRAPTPYGRHASREPAWGPQVPRRLAHALANGLPGVGLFLWLYIATYQSLGLTPTVVGGALLLLWLAHFVHRGLVHPLVTRYGARALPLELGLSALVPLTIFATLNALAIAAMPYPDAWFSSPYFLIGALLFAVGFVLNRHADRALRQLRPPGGRDYAIPRGGLFEWVSSPNYLGELIMWIGWSLATWTAAGAVWTLYVAATLVPRARDHHLWYQERFSDYPARRRALIPFTW